MRLQPVNYQLITSTGKHNLGASSAVSKKLSSYPSYSGCYTVSAPVLGEFTKFWGEFSAGKTDETAEIINKINRHLKKIIEIKPVDDEDLKWIVKQLRNQQEVEIGDKDLKWVAKQLRNQQVMGNIIYCIAAKMKKYANEQKEQLLQELKTPLTFLVTLGVRFDSRVMQDNEMFDDLMSVLGTEWAQFFLAEIALVAEPDKYINKAKKYLKYGANINCNMSFQPAWGTYLHVYLANEISLAHELIRQLHALYEPNKPNTQFNFFAQDGEGKTPLLIAVMIRDEKAALELLRINKKGYPVGIDRADNNGRTALMFAVANGMQKVVAELLNQQVDRTTKDKEGLTVENYLNITEEKLKQILKPLLNAERSSTVKQSYLYFNDEGDTPLCMYENQEPEKWGDDQWPHLVLMSPLPQHKQRIERITQYLLDNIVQPNNLQLLQHILNQTQWITEKTFLDVSRAGREAVKKIWLQQQAATNSVKTSVNPSVPNSKVSLALVKQ